ncbi:hypothetical protein VPH35_130795 [Triticum aestivum]|uniref:VQ domain-containing protein n=1 Tax=Triticum aestivum TaxID=4565 RepID=A0A3B6SJL7_WHEAT|nr:uncharacterized protein LOC123159586 [Triticum aestivum]
MGEHAYDHSSSSGGGMSPSTPPVQQQRRGSSRHAVVPRAATTRPAIRIIHIIAPEIIKTDVDNFRDLVQRLTGRHRHQPADATADDSAAVTVGVATTPLSPVEEKPQPQKKRLAPAPALADDFVAQQENRRRKKIKCEVVKVEEGGFGHGGGDLDFSELWMDLNPGGFLSFLEEDVFQGMMAPDLLQQPLGAPRMDLVGEMCASFLA